ncbi:MAG: DUF2889 domain-containing protein, partial [Acidimicrobiia bacterium]
TPPRQPGSVRRTTPLDGLHPEGPGRPSLLVLRARDLRTATDGTATVLGEVEVRLRVDAAAGVLAVDADPVEARLEGLLGANPFVGWRRTVDELLPDHRDDRTLLYLVLDAVAAWYGLSSFGLAGAARPEGAAPPGRPGRSIDLASRVDLCAGWQEGGTLLQLMRSGQSGAEFVRPPAPALEPPDDPLAWHDTDPLPPFASRRRRRLDLLDGDPLGVDAMFRDSSVDADGTEGVLHEYTVSAAVDPATFRVVAADAVPRALPYQECPQAVASAGQLVDRDVRGLRREVGRELRGITTCTHLNELYRTFADIGALAGRLA